MSISTTLSTTALANAAAKAIAFTPDYYRAVVAQHGYSRFDFSAFTFELGGMPPSELNLRFLCHHDGDGFAVANPGARVITTGFGMSGVPHMGTVTQIAAMCRLQAAGERCQIVLGDLDAHNGKGLPLPRVRDLADRYQHFVCKLGFDPTHGILRDQFNAITPLRTMYLMGGLATDQDFDDVEEDNHDYYVKLGIVDDTMTFRRKLSLLLMCADFVALADTAPSVLVLLGIDEHNYVRFSQRMAKQAANTVGWPGDLHIAAAYTRMISGFGGHPKMSKSVPESSINVESSHDTIARLVASDDATDPGLSPSFQMLNQLFLLPESQTRAAMAYCAEQSTAWHQCKRLLVDALVDIADRW